MNRCKRKKRVLVWECQELVTNQTFKFSINIGRSKVPLVEIVEMKLYIPRRQKKISQIFWVRLVWKIFIIDFLAFSEYINFQIPKMYRNFRATMLLNSFIYTGTMYIFYTNEIHFAKSGNPYIVYRISLYKALPWIICTRISNNVCTWHAYM